MSTRKLPPLNSVKAFEAAARLGSFVLAAAELGVTSVAVSLQVRNLEFYLGKQLFTRKGNRLALTDAGQSVYPQTARALGDLAAMAWRIQEREMRALLVVSVPFSLADIWLAPKLALFFEIFPHMAIDIRVEDDPVDIARHGIDLRVSYGDYHYPDLDITRLFHDEVVPVCTPEFNFKNGSSAVDLTTIHESAFIHTNWGPNYASHPTWGEWFQKSGIQRHAEASSGRRVGLSSLAISTARMGLGIALGQKEMARPDLESGRLIALSPVTIALGYPYCAFVPKTKAHRKDISQLLELLVG
jgi:LysR family glycine cleavage system transcriptional activator